MDNAVLCDRFAVYNEDTSIVYVLIAMPLVVRFVIGDDLPDSGKGAWAFSDKKLIFRVHVILWRWDCFDIFELGEVLHQDGHCEMLLGRRYLGAVDEDS